MKKAIIIGATSGIGLALSRIISSKGYLAGIAGRRISLLEELCHENPGRFIPGHLDLSETGRTEAALDQLCTKLGGLDLLVISSGTGDINGALDYDTEKRTIDVNVSGFTEAATWAFRYFERQGYGHLAAITSLAGLRGNRQAPAYNASKSFQINYLEGLRQRAKRTGLPITVTDIRPGFVDTEMAKGDGIFWAAPPEKAAKQIWHAIMRKREVCYVTRRWTIIALILKLLPRWIYNKL